EPGFAREAAVGGDFADWIAGRHDARGAQFVRQAPELEMFQCALGEVLAFGDARKFNAGFNQRAADTAQPEVDGERHADRSASHDDDLMTRVHYGPLFILPIFSSRPARLSQPGRYSDSRCSGKGSTRARLAVLHRRYRAFAQAYSPRASETLACKIRIAA